MRALPLYFLCPLGLDPALPVGGTYPYIARSSHKIERHKSDVCV